MIVTDDEIARSILGAADWVSANATDVRLIEPIHDAVEAAVSLYLGDNVSSASRTELIKLPDYTPSMHTLPVMESQRGVDAITLKFTPVTLSGIVVSEQRHDLETWSSEHYLTAGEDYQLEDVVSGVSKTGVLRRLGGYLWPSPPGAVLVTYTGGRTEANSPSEWALIKQAIITATRDNFLAAKRATGATGANTMPVSSESIGKYSVSYDTTSLSRGAGGLGLVSAAAMAILSQLVNYDEYL